jgi:hypothetical protein
MRIGDHLLQHGWVSLDDLAHVLAMQHGSGMRLASLLVSHGVVAFDNASRALGEQLGVAAALRKHLQGRDPGVAAMLPAPLARRLVALPIGKLGDGAVIVCVRDPSRATYGHLARAMPGRFVMAVAPAMFLERLVEHVYRPAVDVPIEIDVAPARSRAKPPPIPSAASSAEIPIEIDEPVLAPRASEADVEALFDALMLEPAPPRTTTPSLPVSVARVATRGNAPLRRDALDTTIASFADIDDAEWLWDAAMQYVATRWRAALVFEVRDTAVAVRAHAAKKLTLSLASSSILQRARDERRLVHERISRPSAAQAALAKSLGDAPHPIAAPITREGAARIIYVLAVGQPVRSDEEPEDAAYDLGVLAESMGEALARLGG